MGRGGAHNITALSPSPASWHLSQANPSGIRADVQGQGQACHKMDWEDDDDAINIMASCTDLSRTGHLSAKHELPVTHKWTCMYKALTGKRRRHPAFREIPLQLL